MWLFVWGKKRAGRVPITVKWNLHANGENSRAQVTFQIQRNNGVQQLPRLHSFTGDVGTAFESYVLQRLFENDTKLSQ